MKSIHFLGACGMVTGSSYLLEDDADSKILVDMGSFQGLVEEEKHNRDPLQFDPRSLTAVILTHAHQDHCGRLPLLARHGFSGAIYMTPATKDILEISLHDAVKIAKEEGRKTHTPPAYDESDVEKILSCARTIDYGREGSISRYSFVLKDAGHILGSGSIVLKDHSQVDEIQKIVWSGDLGNSPQDLIRPTERIDEADVVIMESTYGDRAHTPDSPADKIASQIQVIQKEQGTLLIPAFSIERTQMILHLLHHLKASGRISSDLPVFMDSPMAQKVTEVYLQHPDLYSDELTSHAKESNPFSFPGLEIVVEHRESKRIQSLSGPKVIIAGSGMMSGGRIVDHAKHFLPQKNTRLLFVGYQAEGTLGRELEEGARTVRIYGEEVDVIGHTEKIHGMSAHADQPKLLSWLRDIEGVSKVFLTHGEDVSRQVLADQIRDTYQTASVVLPALYEKISLCSGT